MELIAFAWAFVGCAYWLWMAVGAARLVRAIPLLAKLDPPQPEAWPKLSVVIPACNEARNIEAAVDTVLRQDYPHLDVILIDDRSDDGTGRLVDKIARSDRRVRPLHVTELPDGWLGKVHALNRGVELSEGEWLLFTDADVHLAPGTLRRAVAYGEARELDHLAALPDIWPSGFLLDVAVASFLRTLCISLRCWAVEDPRSRAFIGVGAFNLVRRSALEKTPGLQWLKLEVGDDVGLGMMLKRSGARSCPVNATGMVGLYWYRSLGELARGAEKGFASVAKCRLWRLLAACGLFAGLELAPLVALVPVGHLGLLLPAATMLLAAVFSIVVLARWVNRPLLPGLCFPLAVPLSIAVLLRTGWLGLRRGGIQWRGTLYPSKMLREGSRLRLP